MLGFSAVGHAAIGDGGSNPGLNLAVLASALTLTGYTPSLTYTTTLDVGATALTLAGYAPSLTYTMTLNAGVGSLVLTGYAPVLSYAPQIWTPVAPVGGSWAASGPAAGVWTPVPPASTPWSAA